MRKKLYHVWTMLIILVTTTASCQSPLFGARGTPIPTPQCIEPSLTLGTMKYRVESTTREADGFPEIPKRKKDVAYWVEGTTINYVFSLSPTKENLALDSIIKAGDPITINWADCSTDEYIVKSVEAAQAGDLTLFDQSTGGITVFMLTNSSGLVIRGERPSVQSLDTPEPSTDTVQLDISILDMTESEDHLSVTFRLLITNQGAQAVTLTSNDISLTVENHPEVFPTLVTPTLPQEFRPGDIIPVSATFPKPQAPIAVLRIFDITFEYYF